MMDDIAYKKIPLSLSEFNKNSGLFLIHQEIDSTQASRKSYLQIASHTIGLLIIRQVELIALFNYGARDNSILADPRMMTESD